ncbi:hypothetical protein A2631_05620 [Candidatus Daviesbacteria bacterium RIFCSPHIGHO2_01_FULL_44_29]|uniref:Methionine--tRNA ligase n=1 Tax=Candidatus Daviesbacteria bacterium RIFCSPHIGHO2_02_FULL_43_12 TaxID=1797776 RepID=A0A1F5KI07_9BACT|nr:MAG: hypothetical protein A2631_05620 [Candidatus Daviesbacteria bacterium RIFCSPHIGHO2_01_FULL_44_29]OGE39224.1 MAG: hypothetical protein A3E86_01365 [Candidatus Daviesbacteria bacterium RIFCSPHIGHO2_12_FULL_47_45]OGE40573.1 MAG: hypothetical protein A3D25_00445 [Candidatus Daviesbacteria bacterium RIFCSPHIGHO2_02_FULL_43_12]OGE70133.1 MAG: hypothetical protein A3B55_00215 [Candidatus Daviesbacteria bacterium RIFCSPLOWO2_01_FULL_43_15]
MSQDENNFINITDFVKVQLRVGTVLDATGVEGSEKLIKLTIDLGEEKTRTVLTGMRKWYEPDFFVGKQVIIVANLEPRPMMGLVSEGMIVACDSLDPTDPANKPTLLQPATKVPNGSKIR